jgi:ArsR family transcriptional regulator
MDAQLMFDSVTDATRRRILALLVDQGELCVCELTAALNEIQPKVSRHLGVLKDAGIVNPRREGTWMFYRLAAALPAWTSVLLETLTKGAVPELKADLKRLKAMDGRPERCAARGRAP